MNGLCNLMNKTLSGHLKLSNDVFNGPLHAALCVFGFLYEASSFIQSDLQHKGKAAYVSCQDVSLWKEFTATEGLVSV